MVFHSYDIFDTLITRCTDSPNGVFAIVQRILQDETIDEDGIFREFYHSRTWNCFVNNYVAIRSDAEKRTKEIAFCEGREDVSIIDIYEEIKRCESIDPETMRKTMDVEIRVERSCVVPIYENIERIKEDIDKGIKVVLISDMYLGEPVLRTILTEVDEVFRNVPIYVSCDYNMTKLSGTLYRLVRRRENVLYSEWKHIGDNIVSDDTIPQILGIKTERISEQHKTPRLRFYQKNLDSNKAEIQLMMGALKTIQFKNDIEIIGAEIAGPVVFSFVRWVIDTCIERGARNIYFVARDGYILKKVGDIIISTEHLSIKTHYLYSSRRAFQVNEDKSKKLLLDYVKQEMDVTDMQPIFVDVRGTGYTVNTLFELLRSEYGIHPVACYHTMYSSIQKSYGDFLSYTHGDFGDAVEVFCRAPEGECLYYKKDNCDKVIPVTDESVSKWEMTGVNDFNRGIVRFVDCYESVLNRLCIRHVDREMHNKAIYYYMNIKDKILDDYTGDFPFDIDEKGDIDGFAEKISAEDAVKDYLYGIAPDYRSRFFSVSYLRSSSKVKSIIKKYNSFSYKLSYEEMEKYKYTLKKIDKKIKRIIIYGAGKLGIKVFRAVECSDDYAFVAWTDTNYKSKKNDLIISPKEALKKPHDLLVIAIGNKKWKELIFDLLREAGEKEIKFADDLLIDKM